MSTLLLVRHGLTKMTGPVLAGRTPGVHLDERGEKQAAAVAERMADFARAGATTLTVAPFGARGDERLRSLEVAMAALEASGAAGSAS